MRGPPCSLQKATKALTNLDRVTILSEALPYLQKFRSACHASAMVVSAWGGSPLHVEGLRASVAWAF